jgi:hypothetical protein
MLQWNSSLSLQGAGSLNQRVKKNNPTEKTTPAQQENKPVEAPKEAEPKKSEETQKKSKQETPKKSKSSKRKRTSDASERSESKRKSKKSRVEEKTPVEAPEQGTLVINSSELKWKRKITKQLKKADDKTLTKDALRKKVVDAFFQEWRKSMENSFDAQV